jgi:hypothetical protein
MRVPVTEQVDRDSGREIEIFLAVLAVEIGALPLHRPHFAAGIDRHERRNGHRRDSCDCEVETAAPL